MVLFALLKLDTAFKHLSHQIKHQVIQRFAIVSFQNVCVCACMRYQKRVCVSKQVIEYINAQSRSLKIDFRHYAS